MRTFYHQSIVIEDALKGWPEAHWESIAKNWGTSVEGARHAVRTANDEGSRFLRHEACDNFDDQTGCRGHFSAE